MLIEMFIVSYLYILLLYSSTLLSMIYQKFWPKLKEYYVEK